MSTTIDSAIIKALVEHIGGNPDDIGGNVDSSDVSLMPTVNKMVPSQDCIMSKDDTGNLTIHCETGLTDAIKLGHIIRLKKIATNEYINFVCTEIYYTKYYPIFNFIDPTKFNHGFRVETDFDDGKDTTITTYADLDISEYETPDGETTGYMIPETRTSFTDILDGLSNTLKHIYKKILPMF